MTSPRAPPDDAYTPTPVVLGKRKRSVSAPSNTDHAIHIADKKPELLPVEAFCGPGRKCSEYVQWKRLKTHLVKIHSDYLPGEDKTLWRGDQKYTDPEEAAEYLARAHIAKKGLALAPGTNPLSAPTLQHGSPPHLDRMPHDTRSGSMSGYGLPPNTGTDSYSDPMAQSQVQMSSLPTVSNVPFEYPSHWPQPHHEHSSGACPNTSSSRPPLDPNYHSNLETMHNGFSTNHEHGQPMMSQNHQPASAYQQPIPNYLHYQSMQNTLAAPNMNQTASSPSQHAS
jgi:hypothetical protein